ncbi:MAG: hypothetical protein AAF959_11350 [Cyanobacteria bacterium P01_D01_bin.56]
MLETIPPILLKAGLVAAGAAGEELIRFVLPYLNNLINRIRPQAKILAQMLPMMDLLLGKQADSLQIKDVNVLTAATIAAGKLAEEKELSGDDISKLIARAVDLFDYNVFFGKLLRGELEADAV